LRLKLVGDLGQVLFFPFNLRDEESIRKAMKYSNVVINLIGRDWETMNFKFNDVNVTGARLIAKLARECGVKRLIHFSSLNADPHPKGVILSDGSEFLRTKYLGEQAVREEFPDATIFRPADIFGEEDRFIKYYAHFWRRNFTIVPLWHKGERTVKQPVHVGDVASGVMNALKDPDSVGRTYDIVGPHAYKLSDLVDYFLNCMRRDEELGYRRVELRWNLLFRARISLTQKFCMSWPVGYLGWDKMERDHVTDTTSLGNPTLLDLGVSPEAIENYAAWNLKPHRAYNYYDYGLGEYPTPPPPKPYTEL